MIHAYLNYEFLGFNFRFVMSRFHRNSWSRLLEMKTTQIKLLLKYFCILHKLVTLEPNREKQQISHLLPKGGHHVEIHTEMDSLKDIEVLFLARSCPAIDSATSALASDSSKSCCSLRYFAKLMAAISSLKEQ